MPYTAILLDADGTIFDYDSAEAQAIERACGDFTIDHSNELYEQYRMINNRLWELYEKKETTWERLNLQRFEEFLAFAASTADPRDFSRRYLNHLGDGAMLLDQAERVCRSLAATHTLAIITNGHFEVQRRRLNASPIAQCFADIIISEEVGYAKPDPRIFAAAFDRLPGHRPENILMVGDNLSADIQGGINAGLDTCWINPAGASRGEVTPTYEIKEISELLSILV